MAALGLGAVLLLTACSSSDDDVETSPAPVVEATTQAPAPPVEEPETEEPAPADPGGSADPLQAMIDAEEAQLEQMAGMFEEIYSDITIEADPPSGIIYTYTYLDQLDPASASAALEEMGETLDTMVKSTVFPGMEMSGVPKPFSATYVYLNADGSELWSGTVTSE